NGLIPLNEHAHRLATSNDFNFKGNLHPDWKKLGWRPDNATAAAPAAPAAAPVAPPSPPPSSATPTPGEQADASLRDLEARGEEILQQLQAANDPQTREQLSAQLQQIVAQLEAISG